MCGLWKIKSSENIFGGFTYAIFFLDYIENGSSKKKYYDVGKIILARLKELKKYQHKKDE